MKFSLLEKMVAKVLIFAVLFFNLTVYSQEKSTSLTLVENFEITRPEGTLTFQKFDTSNKDGTIINLNFQSSSNQTFFATVDSINKLASFQFSGGSLQFHWLNNGFYQVKLQRDNGQSSVLTLDENGSPQNPNALAQFSELLNSIMPSFDSCASSFLSYGFNSGLWNRAFDGEIVLNVQKFKDEYLQTYGLWGCVIAVIAWVVATVGMIVACASGVGCLIGVIGQKLAIVSMILACFAPEA